MHQLSNHGMARRMSPSENCASSEVLLELNNDIASLEDLTILGALIRDY